MPIASLPRPLAQVADRVLGALAPAWRFMWIIVGASYLYHATVAAGYGHGRILWSQGFAAVLCGVLALACFWVATRPALPEALALLWGRLPGVARWRVWRAALTVYLLWVPWHGFVAQLPAAIRGDYHNDAIAYIHSDADTLRQGANPYTDDNAFWQAAVRWPHTGATPLLGSPHFGANPLNYPSTRLQETLLHDQIAHPALRDGDFDPRTVHNYPAGIVWLALPLVWAGVPSVIWLNFLALVGIAILLARAAPPGLRLPVVVALGAAPVLWLYSLLENYDAVCVVFILAAWQLWPRSRLSPLALGIACAVKQLAWFFAPFYLVEAYRRGGWRAALARLCWLAVGFILPNLPFIIAAPGAWGRSLLVPQTDAFFPVGYGLIDLALGGIVPIGFPVFWSGLEGMALLALLIYQLRRRAVTSDGIILALVPLWFAWRSPMNYFAFLPMLALWLTLQKINGSAGKPALPLAQPTTA